MPQPKWLSSYFDSYFSKQLRPSLILDGQEHAVVMVGGGDYLLVLKSGKLGVTPQQIIFSGRPTPQDMEKMKEKLKQSDA